MSNDWRAAYGISSVSRSRYAGKLIKQGTVFVNGSQWSNPRSDELMDKATVEPDPKKRAEYYHAVQKIVVDGSPIAPAELLEGALVAAGDGEQELGVAGGGGIAPERPACHLTLSVTEKPFIGS